MIVSKRRGLLSNADYKCQLPDLLVVSYNFHLLLVWTLPINILADMRFPG